MSYAVINLYGHQYIVHEGDKVKVDSKFIGDDKTIKIQSLAHGDNQPTEVEAEVIVKGRNKKVIVFKKNRRHNSRKFNTHRQHFALLEIKSIGGKSTAKKVKATKSKESVTSQKSEKENG